MLEFVILEKEGENKVTYKVIDSNSLKNSENAIEQETNFDTVEIQEVNGNRFTYSNYEEIGENDLVYILGIVPDKEGVVFVIENEIRGEIFKNNGGTSNFNIRNINEEYEVKDYMMNIGTKQYVLIGIMKDAYVAPPEEEHNSNESNEDIGLGINIATIILGVLGVLGGGFLIMRMRKQVSAA